ncbi:MAG: division plane positioning ATPase MipZ [Rhodospirillales bacterium]
MMDILARLRGDRTGEGVAAGGHAVSPNADAGRGRVIVVANEKGGCGKSTIAMHLAVALAKQGGAVATLDLDVRQGSLTRYVANRRRYADIAGAPIVMPHHIDGEALSGLSPNGSDKAEERLAYVIDGSRANVDYLIIDTPGSDTPLGRLAHRRADLIVTPVNDSFVDLDVIAQIDARRKTVIGPSAFSTLLLEDRQTRQEEGGQAAPWLVARNRLGTLESHNARDVDWALALLERSLGLKVIPGFSERVIFRELFLVGLTILDLKDAAGGQPLSRSHMAAREEVLALSEAILANLPKRTQPPK